MSGNWKSISSRLKKPSTSKSISAPSNTSVTLARSKSPSEVGRSVDRRSVVQLSPSLSGSKRPSVSEKGRSISSPIAASTARRSRKSFAGSVKKSPSALMSNWPSLSSPSTSLKPRLNRAASPDPSPALISALPSSTLISSGPAPSEMFRSCAPAVSSSFSSVSSVSTKTRTRSSPTASKSASEATSFASVISPSPKPRRRAMLDPLMLSIR